MNRGRISTSLALLSLSVLMVAAGMECPPNNNMNMNGNNNNNNNNNNNGNNNGTNLVAVDSGITVRHDTSIRVGDDLIVFGVGAVNGVEYIVPSTTPTTGMTFTNSTNFRSVAFEVLGKKIALLDQTFMLTIYDTENATSHVFDITDVRVSNIPIGEHPQGPLHGDGNLLVICNDPTDVTDMNNIKVADLSTATPTLTALKNAPGITGVSSAQIQTARVNESKKRVVGARNNVFYMWDLDNPMTDPVEFDRSGDGGIGAEDYRFDGTYILYEDSEGPANIHIFNVETGTDTMLTKNPGQGPLALNGGSFCYFLDRDFTDDSASGARSAIGEAPGPDSVEGGVDGADPRDSDPEYLGYGGGCAITPDGSMFFIAGDECVNVTTEYIQVSTGGDFVALKNGDEDFLGTDVACSSNTVGFRTGANNDTTIAYIILP